MPIWPDRINSWIFEIVMAFCFADVHVPSYAFESSASTLSSLKKMLSLTLACRLAEPAACFRPDQAAGSCLCLGGSRLRGERASSLTLA